MALDSTLVRVAGGLITAAGSYSAILPGTPACKAAIASGSENLINSVCGPLFGNESLIALIIIGGVVVIFTTPIKDAFEVIFKPNQTR
jgi:hypothetical protein